MISSLFRASIAMTAALSVGVICVTGCGTSNDRQETSSAAKTTATATRIDSHAHVYLETYDASIESPLVASLEKTDTKWLDICTGGLRWGHLQVQVEAAKKLHAAYPNAFSWAVSFNLTNWGEPDWEKSALAYVEDGFTNGAVAVKVWKEIGMELKDPDGSYVMVDDPRFAPILDLIEHRGKTLVCHLGEPRNCWLPLEEMTVNGDRNYFKNNSQYHAYLHPEIPSYEAQIAARDHILELHPNLRVVGCHLGSLEYDTDEIAKRLEKYPNFAVDTAARIIHFKVQDREKVRAFCIKYQDRILYGTDFVLRTADNLDGTLKRLEALYDSDYRYFSTGDDFTIEERTEPVKGLDLPPDVVKKIFITNAEMWYPGI